MELEVQQAFLEGGERVEVVGGEDLSLDNGEEDLDLVESAGVDWRAHDDEIGPPSGQPLLAGLAAMGAAIVDDPEDPGGGAAGLLRHHLANEPSEGSDAGLVFAAAEDACALDVRSGQVGPGSFAGVLMFDLYGVGWSWWGGSVFAAACLDAGLLVGGDHVFVCAQGLPLPASRVEVETRPAL